MAGVCSLDSRDSDFSFEPVACSTFFSCLSIRLSKSYNPCGFLPPRFSISALSHNPKSCSLVVLSGTFELSSCLYITFVSPSVFQYFTLFKKVLSLETIDWVIFGKSTISAGTILGFGKPFTSFFIALYSDSCALRIASCILCFAKVFTEETTDGKFFISLASTYPKRDGIVSELTVTIVPSVLSTVNLCTISLPVSALLSACVQSDTLLLFNSVSFPLGCIVHS